MAWYMIWPCEDDMLYGMTWRTCHGLWYGLAGTVWYIVWPGAHAGYMVRPSGHGIWYGLVRIA